MAAAAQASPSLEQSETPTRTSAPYGQACTNCAKAKCKCILVAHPNPGLGRGSRPTCERCARLGRECKPSSSVRKRGAAGSKRATGGPTSAGASSSMSAASRAANLEQKLEDLVAILKAQASSTSASTSAQAPSQPDVGELPRQGRSDQSMRVELGVTTSSVPNRRSNDVGNRTVSGGPAVITPASTSYATCSTPGSTPSPLPAPVHDTLTSAAQAEETLMFFRQHHLKSFPFVYLPPDMTAAQLQRDRPYLWLNIHAVCCKSPLKQAVLSQQTRGELANRILVTCERNIDMLLGSLCLLGWTVHLCFRPTMTAVIGMAIAIVTDLRLDKPGQDDDPRIMNCFKSAHFVKVAHSGVRTMEERRATLACYVMCSSGSSFLRCPTMRWTSHMEDSLNILTANPEWEGDQILVLMVRIHRLAENIFQSQPGWAPESDSYGTLKPPSNIYVKYFRRCLQTIKDQVPESLKNNRLATSIIMSAEMIISEIPFCNPTCGGRMPEWHTDAHMRQPGAQSHGPRPMDVGRVEANFATLQTSKAFFEHFLTFDLDDFVGFSFPVLLNFFRAAQILYRLHVIDEPGWDHSAVSSSVDLLATMDLVANQYNRIPALYGFLTETDAEGNEVTNFYVKCSKTFSSTMPMWRAHFEQAEAARRGAGADADTGIGADAAGSGGDTGSQAPPAMMGAPSLNPTLGGRVNYPGMNNFMLPELFPMDFSMDDAWCNELWNTWDASVLGPMQ
ncbi:hypothetical protein F5Y10DRAFT_257975 [Nemania abortiva]|nr:hypothetical protein F5Y10DRAFT_257975 [Nemania abortiva]